MENSIPVCTNCGNPCKGEYYRYSSKNDIWKRSQIFCLKCFTKPACQICSSRLDVAPLRDGRMYCRMCRQNGIFTLSQGRPYLDAAQKMLAERFGFPIDPALIFKILPHEIFYQGTSTKTALGYYCDNKHIAGWHLLLTGDCRTLYAWQDNLNADEIHILEGLPSPVFFNVVIHELSHAYLHQRFGAFPNQKLEEGFCEAIAAACAVFNGQPEVTESLHIHNSDLVYGDGFRLIYAMLQERGWKAVMSYLKKHSQSKEEYVWAHIYEWISTEMADMIRKSPIKPKLKFEKYRG